MTERDPARVIWSLTASGLGTAISGSGNSGAWSSANPSFETLVDLRFTDDLALYVYVASIGSSPSLTVKLDGYDDFGNLFPGIAATTAITAAGAATPVYIGRHGATAGTYVVLPQWGRVSWTCTGGSASGVEILLLGR